MPLYHITHVTEYQYEEAVSVAHNELRLIPRTSLLQICHNYHYDVSPRPAALRTRTDYFGNDVTYFTLQELHRRLRLQVASTVEVQPPPAVAAAMPWETVAHSLRDELDVYQYAFDSPHVPRSSDLQAYARLSFGPARPIGVAALELCHRIHEEFRYVKGATTVSTPLQEVLASRRGVCQDFAHLAIGCLRSVGLAARYVSGYLQTVAAPGQARLVGADASHAWLSVYCGDGRWVDLDPTNDLIPSDRHVTLAYGRDYADVAPIKGVVQGGGHHQVKVSVDVAPLQPAAP